MANKVFKHSYKVYYADTDAYGVAWHGAYLRFMEMARVEVCNLCGLKLSVLKKENIVLPVHDINITYKCPSYVEDEIDVYTSLIEDSPFSLTFLQIIKKGETILTTGTVKVVSVDNNGRLYRKMPQILVDFTNKLKGEK